MGTAVDTGEVIVILSDDEDAEENISFSDQSVVIVEAEDVKKSGNSCVHFFHPSSLDVQVVISSPLLFQTLL